MITVEELLQKKNIVDACRGEKTKILRVNGLKDSGFEDGEIMIKSLPPDVMASVQKQGLKDGEKGNIQAVFEGVVQPNLKDVQLKEAYGCFAPDDIVYKIFSPVEADRIAKQINILSGYGEGNKKAIEEIKK